MTSEGLKAPGISTATVRVWVWVVPIVWVNVTSVIAIVKIAWGRVAASFFVGVLSLEGHFVEISDVRGEECKTTGNNTEYVGCEGSFLTV